MTEREEHLAELLRRLLHVNEVLRVQNGDLHELVQQLGREYRAVRDELATACRNHAVEAAAADVFCGAAIDELLAGRGR